MKLRHQAIGKFCALIECFVGGLFPFVLPVIAPLMYAGGLTPEAVEKNLAIIGLSLWAYPLGSALIGWIGDRWGRRLGLIVSISFLISGVALVLIAPLGSPVTVPLWFIALSVYSMGSGGEINGGALLTLEHTPRESWGKESGKICVFSVAGIFLSACVAAVLEPAVWRVPFGVGMIALFSCFLSLKHLPKDKIFPSRPALRPRLKSVVLCFAVAGLFGAAYYGTFVFLPQAVPSFTSLAQSFTLKVSSVHLLTYLVCLGGAGVLADKIGIVHTMRWGAIGIGAVTPVAFWLCLGGSRIGFIIGQGLLALVSGLFIGPSHAFMATLFPPQIRYRSIAMTFTLAMMGVGGATSSLCYWFWRNFQLSIASGGWIVIWAGIAAFLLTGVLKRKRILHD